MFKGKTVIIISIFISSMALSSCVNNQNLTSKNVEEIFSLDTTPCENQCPVYELSLYGNKKLIFNGEENTSLNGKHEKTLSDEQFEALLGIIESADWVNLDNDYRSNVQGLPTQKFTYNRNGINKRVSRYGAGPESISNLSEIILEFVENQVFNE
ncbi:DUF6438 domain-containing protein [Marivirga sp.]|uniref:DUF6438 domain-containing protein n=1 Tax=Marivirga sp. TaxID=2018662 RepID=UPI003DA78E19